MFSAGTRVYVHSSSVAGKKLGAKANSLGFVSSGDLGYLVNYVKEFPLKKQKFLVSPMRIVFTRYGKEQKERKELRDILGILPLVSGAKPESVKKKTLEVMDILAKGELINNHWWMDMSHNYSSSELFGVILPVGKFETGEMTPDQLDAWAMSILANKIFQAVLSQNKNLPTLNRFADTTGESGLLSWILNATAGGSVRRDLLQWAKDTPANTSKLIRCLRGLNITINRRTLEGSFFSTQAHFKKGKSMDAHRLYSWITYGVMEDPTLLPRKLKVVDLGHYNQETNNIFKHMGTVLETLLTLKPKHI